MMFSSRPVRIMTLIFLSSFVCFFSLGSSGADQKYVDSSNRGYVDVGDSAPDFTIPLIDGSTFTLADYAGYVVLINQWANW